MLSVIDQLQARSGPQFRCPGESEPISRAVHLSRMARFYPACRRCPHANGGVSAEGEAAGEVPAALGAHHETIRTNGVRGVYLNEIGRAAAEKLGAAIAEVLWEQSPRRGRSEDDWPASPASGPLGPEVVVARDSRASSADIACGVVRGLKRMNCRIIELGVTIRPSVDFAVYHLRASGGIHVTGSGGPAALTGLDVIGGDGVPWSRPGLLDRLADWETRVPARPARSGGSLETCDLTAPERAELQRHLHGLRHCRVGVLVEGAAWPARLRASFAGTAIDPLPLPAPPVPFGATEWPTETRRELRKTLQSERLELLVRIAEDGRAVQLFDEQARPVAADDWLLRLAEQSLGRSSTRRIIVGADVSPVARGRLKAHGAEVLTAGATEQALAASLTQEQGDLAADGRGRIWFRDHYPLCHALVTLSHLARLAADLQQPISHWAA